MGQIDEPGTSGLDLCSGTYLEVLQSASWRGAQHGRRLGYLRILPDTESLAAHN